MSVKVINWCASLALGTTALTLPAFTAVGSATAVTPPNDNFSAASDLKIGTNPSVSGGAESESLALWYTRFFDNTGGTSEPGEPSHAADPNSPAHSIWYKWTAPWSAKIRLRAIVSGDHENCFAETNLAVYTGDTVSALRGVASAAAGPCAYATIVTELQAGRTYRIAVDSSSEAYGWLYFEVWPHCTVRGTDASETLWGSDHPDVICGMGGDDRIYPSGGDDIIVGGPGVDAVTYEDSPSPVTVLLNQASAVGDGSDFLLAIENVIGSPFSDKINGENSRNVLNGGPGAAGHDQLWGLGGDDVLFGGEGNDIVGGGSGNDSIYGGPGVDTVSYSKAPPVTVNLKDGISSGYGDDVLSTLEGVIGSRYSDRITGNNLPNRLMGGAGSDTIAGLDGNDHLLGEDGGDNLDGGVGSDVCDGGIGTDTATASCESRLLIP